MMGEWAPAPVTKLPAPVPATVYPLMVLPSVLVGGEKETSAVYGQAVALTFVAVIVAGTAAAVAPELDELLEPELLELLLPPLELLEELLLELPLLELLLELPPLELLELEPLAEQS